MSVIDNALPRIFPLISSLLVLSSYEELLTLSSYEELLSLASHEALVALDSHESPFLLTLTFWRSHCISCKYILHLYLDVIHMTKDLAHKLR